MMLMENSKKALEVGVGGGYHLRLISSLKPKDCTWVATDVSNSML